MKPGSDSNNLITSFRASAAMKFWDRRLLSLMFFQAWIFSLYHSSFVVSVEGESYTTVYVVSLVSACLVLLLQIFISFHRSIGKYLLPFGSVLGAAGVLLVHFLQPTGILLIFGSCLLGICAGVLVPFIGKTFSYTGMYRIMVQTFGAFFCASIIYVIILGFTDILRVCCVALLPLCSALSLLINPRVRPKVELENVDGIQEVVHTAPMKGFCLGCVIVGVSFGFSIAFCGSVHMAVVDESNLWGISLFALATCVYLVLVRLFHHRFDFERFFMPVIPLLVVGMLVFSYSLEVSIAFITVGFQLADAIIWIVCSWVASKPGISKRAFCQMKTCEYVGMLIGAVAAEAINYLALDIQTQTTVTSIFVFMMVLAGVTIFNNSSVVRAIKTSVTKSDWQGVAGFLSRRCTKLAGEYGLTDRESEVLRFLAQGRSLPFIEERLSISHGTANAHRDHIYAKMNIHNKQELIDIFFNDKADA